MIWPLTRPVAAPAVEPSEPRTWTVRWCRTCDCATTEACCFVCGVELTLVKP